MTIDLSKYLNKTITVEVGNGTIKTSTVGKCSSKTFPYTFDHFCYTIDGTGRTQPNIVRIISVEQFKGISQKAPNINLKDFVGQRVYVKDTNGHFYFSYVEKLDEEYELKDISNYFKNGINSCGFSGLNIEEIYGEGAYEIKTKSTFDEPEDSQIKQAKQLLSQMSEEQVAKLLKSL